MHDDITGQGTGRYLADPLRRAPPAGLWVLWHGSHALATIELAKKKGQALPRNPEVALPEGLPRPTGNGTWWSLQVEGQSYLLRTDEHNGYISCYLGNMTGAAEADAGGG